MTHNKDRWAVRLNLEIHKGEEDPLAVIDGIVSASRGVDAALRQWVSIAREKGCSWKAVGDALGVSRQSAWERFKDVDGEDAVDRFMGAFKGRIPMTSQEIHEASRREEEEIELRKYGSLPPGTKWRS